MSPTPSPRRRGRPPAGTPAPPAAAPAPAPAADPTPFAGASPAARRLAATILEVLAGSLRPAEAGRALGLSLARYYQLELRAVAGLVAACEPRRRGHAPAAEPADLRRECERLRRECARQQALVRAARQAVGLTLPAPPEPPAARKRRPTVRALKMAALLQPFGDAAPAAPAEAPAEPAAPECPPTPAPP